jgi:hypothetical protein
MFVCFCYCWLSIQKGRKIKAENYRPISLTCICCKLMEHIITSNIMKHLDSNNILYDLQHVFRKARSCESQLLPFIQELNASNNKNIQTYLIIMDFAKAFDKVSHRRLLYNRCMLVILVCNFLLLSFALFECWCNICVFPVFRYGASFY